MKIINELFFIFLRLGCTSFGGPIAHIGYFNDEFVLRRKWLSQNTFSEIVALCQFLPGPSSSQVGLLIGFSRARYFGALAAWCGFTLPSAFFLMAVAYASQVYAASLPEPILHGLKLAAVAIIAQALWSMARAFCTDSIRIALALGSASILNYFYFSTLPMLIILFAGLAGYFLLRKAALPNTAHFDFKASRKMGIFSLIVFFVFLLTSFLITTSDPVLLRLVASFYRAGSMVFGGGHVVLPLLQTELVQTGLISQIDFLNAYALAQSVPGPLFTISSYIGVRSEAASLPLISGLCSLIAIFIPSFFMIFGILPFWDQLKNRPYLKRSLMGINAAVVGLLLSVFIHPVWSSSIFNSKDILIAIAAFLILLRLRWPSWTVILFCLIFSYV